MERIGNERRRLRNVRQRMAAAIEVQAKGNQAFVPFYIAVADYIDATMQRLHGQDVRMGEMITEKVSEPDDLVRQGLKELDDRLEGAAAHLKPFLGARDALRASGVDALENFEAEAQVYSDFVTSTMGHHSATNDLCVKIFKPADWEYMAAISPEQQAEDERLYADVVESMPDGVAVPTD